MQRYFCTSVVNRQQQLFPLPLSAGAARARGGAVHVTSTVTKGGARVLPTEVGVLHGELRVLLTLFLVFGRLVSPNPIHLHVF